MRCDLHLHSNCSDGRLSPREVVLEARAAGLDCIALTDHDTLAGVEEARAEAEQGNSAMRVIWGCEVTSSVAGAEVHLLAYFRQRPGVGFEEFLVEGRLARRHRIADGLRLLQEEHGIDIELSEVEGLAGGAVLSRAHVAQALVARRVVPDKKRAFQRLLGDDHGLFPATVLDPDAACDSIHAAGGLAVWAHPAAAHFDATLAVLLEAGLDGIEIITRRSGRNERAIRAAADHGLLASGGSDWHGHGIPPSRGRWHVPGEAILALLERLGVEA